MVPMVRKANAKSLSWVLRLTSAFFFGLSVGLGGLASYYGSQKKEERQSKQRSVATDAPPSKQEQPAIGTDIPVPASSEVVARHGPYVSAFDKRLRNPAWACIRLAKRDGESAPDDDTDKADRSLSKFKADPNVPELFRTRPEDFKASGYDRGHLVAAGDVTTQQEMDETFLMSNISPQVGVGMNRGFWLLLEKFVRRLTAAYENVFVCSGPLFLPEFDQTTQSWIVKYTVIGPKHDIAVPTHFFKCVHAKNGDQVSQTCFVVPNRQIDHTREPLSKFETPIEEVESLAGFELFASERHSERSVCDEIKCDLLKEAVFSKTASKKTLA